METFFIISKEHSVAKTWLRPESAPLKDSNDECKKTKGTKKCVVTRELKFQDYKHCIKVSQTVNIVNYLEKK